MERGRKQFEEMVIGLTTYQQYITYSFNKHDKRTQYNREIKCDVKINEQAYNTLIYREIAKVLTSMCLKTAISYC